MIGPFKMKYTKSQKSAFPFKGEPLKMYGGMKSSPMRSFWSKIKNTVAGITQKAKGAIGGLFGGGGGGEGGEGGGVSASDVPQHGQESHSGGGRRGPFGGQGGPFGGMMGGGGGQNKWGQGGGGGSFGGMMAGGMGEEGGDPTQTGGRRWGGGRG